MEKTTSLKQKKRNLSTKTPKKLNYSNSQNNIQENSIFTQKFNKEFFFYINKRR